LKQASHTGHYLRELQQAGYATDPNYADKIMAIYQGIALPEAALDQVSAIASDQSKRQL
jgi:flagellar protein FlgJ